MGTKKTILVGAGVGAMVAAVAMLTRKVTDDNIRKRQKHIRGSQNALFRSLKEADALRRKIRSNPRDAEYNRRGALIDYHKARINLLKILITQIREASLLLQNQVREVRK